MELGMNSDPAVALAVFTRRRWDFWRGLVALEIAQGHSLLSEDETRAFHEQLIIHLVNVRGVNMRQISRERVDDPRGGAARAIPRVSDWLAARRFRGYFTVKENA